MPKGKPLSKEDKDKLKLEIAEYLKAGNSQHAAVKKFGCAATVHSVAKEIDLKVPDAKAAQTKNANNARQFYTKDRRMKLYDKFLDKCWLLLEDEEITPHGIQALSIAIGTMCDKIKQDENGGSEGKAAILLMMDEIRKNST